MRGVRGEKGRRCGKSEDVRRMRRGDDVVRGERNQTKSGRERKREGGE